jgi:AcrR family transcriptional regulator
MTGAMTSRQERAAATRQHLIEVAVHQFAAKPYNEVAVGEIAEGAGVAHGLLFHHFGNKRGLYLEAVREISHRLFELHTADSAAPPGEQLRDVLRQHFLRMAEHEDLLLGYVRNSVAMAADPEAWDALEVQRVRMVTWMCEITGLDPENVALCLAIRSAGDAMDQLTVRWLRQGRTFEIEKLVEAMVNIVIGAIRAAHSLDPSLNIRRAVKLLT